VACDHRRKESLPVPCVCEPYPKLHTRIEIMRFAGDGSVRGRSASGRQPWAAGRPHRQLKRRAC